MGCDRVCLVLRKVGTVIPLHPLIRFPSNIPLIFSVIVKATNGPRYVVGCRRQLDKQKLKGGTRVALDMTTLTIMRHLPREVTIMRN